MFLDLVSPMLLVRAPTVLIDDVFYSLGLRSHSQLPYDVTPRRVTTDTTGLKFSTRGDMHGG